MRKRKHTSGEVLIELHYTSGRSVRVVAIDPVTGTEVTTMGDSKRGEDELKRVAANKLRYVLNKNRKAKEAENDLF